MITTLANILEIDKETFVNNPNLIENCTGCNKPLEQHPRIPTEERYIMGAMPDKCSDCYESIMMNYIETHYPNGLNGTFTRETPEN